MKILSKPTPVDLFNAWKSFYSFYIWALRRPFEVKIFGTTYGLAVIHFLVLAAKRLVVSKIFVSQTPFKIEFWVASEKNRVKIRKTDGTHSNYMQLKIPSKPTSLTIWKSFYGVYV